MRHVRFHLAKGRHHLHWQVKNPDTGRTWYFDPKEVSLTLVGCKLVNRPGTARKINEGANKSVCAWIECQDVFIGDRPTVQYEPLAYNPKVTPHWRDSDGSNIDKTEWAEVRTAGNKLYGTKTVSL